MTKIKIYHYLYVSNQAFSIQSPQCSNSNSKKIRVYRPSSGSDHWV